MTVNFQIVVNTPSCNCAEQTWDSGSSSSHTVASVISSASATQITIAAPTRTSGWNSLTPALRACGSCADTGEFTTVTLSDDTALPAWMTWSSGSGTHNILNVKPVDGAVMASNPWNIKAVYTPTYGVAAVTYNILAITVTCEVTAVTTSSAPGNAAYTLFDPSQVIDLTGVTYTQAPVCGYTFSVTATYATSPSASYVTSGSVVVPSVEIYSADSATAGTVTVTMTSTVTFASG